MKTILPMQTDGGIFLALVGFGLIIGGMIGGAAIAVGLIIGAILALLLIRVSHSIFGRPFGQPSQRHFIVWATAVVLQILAFIIVGRMGYFQHGTIAAWTLGLTIVAIHFIVMFCSHGPLILYLAVALLLWILIAHIMEASLVVLIIGDGLLKLLFGCIMSWPLFKCPIPTAFPNQAES